MDNEGWLMNNPRIMRALAFDKRLLKLTLNSVPCSVHHNQDYGRQCTLHLFPLDFNCPHFALVIAPILKTSCMLHLIQTPVFDFRGTCGLAFMFIFLFPTCL